MNMSRSSITDHVSSPTGTCCSQDRPSTGPTWAACDRRLWARIQASPPGTCPPQPPHMPSPPPPTPSRPSLTPRPRPTHILHRCPPSSFPHSPQLFGDEPLREVPPILHHHPHRPLSHLRPLRAPGMPPHSNLHCGDSVCPCQRKDSSLPYYTPA